MELELREPHKKWLTDNWAKRPESKAFMDKLWEIRCQFNQVLDVGEDDHRFNFGNEEDEKRGLVIDNWLDEVEKHKLVFKRVIRANPETPEGSPQELQEKEWEKEAQLCRIHAYWAMIDPKEVHHIIKILGVRAGRFMAALSVHITAQLLEQYVSLFSRVVNRRYQLQGRPILMKPTNFATVSNEGEDDDSDEEELWEELASRVPNETAGMLGGGDATLKVEIQFHWSGVPYLLDTAKVETVAELSGCAADSGVFAAVSCRSLLEYQWKNSQTYFLVDRAFDVLCIFCLFMLVWSIKIDSGPGLMQDRREQALGAAKGYYIVLVVVNALVVLNVFCEAATALYTWTKSWVPSFGPYLSLMTCGLVGMELTTCYQLNVMWGTMMTDRVPYAQSIFVTKPILCSMLILFKWLQFMSGCIVFEFFGLTVLPAFYAMTSAESIKFICYLGLILTMCTHAYWSIPLAPDDYEMDGPNGSLFISFFRMFRLAVMGDFDVFELEGIDPMIDSSNVMDENPDDWSLVTTNVTDNITGLVTSVTTAGKAFYFHKGIRILTMLFGVGCTVIVMNMYIGVLSVSYEDAREKSIETFCHAKSKFMVRYLLRRAVLRRVVRFVTCGQLCQDSDWDGHKDTARETLRADNAVFYDFFDKEEAYVVNEDGNRPGETGMASDEEADEDFSPVTRPPEFTEDLLPQKDSWLGFWCTVPTDRLPPRTEQERFEKMEENQEDMKAKLEALAKNVMNLQKKLAGGRVGL